MKYATTKQTAAILGISESRLCLLLRKKRVKGAYKKDGIWIIRLFRGLPKIKNKTKGPKGKWVDAKPKSKTVIHINKQAIAHNHKRDKEKIPTICVKQGSSRHKTNTYVHHVKILGDCEVVYRPEKPLDCSAVAWIETFNDVAIFGESMSARKVMGIMRSKSTKK